MFVPIPVLLVAGCVGDPEVLEPSPAEWVDASTADGYEALSSVGVAPHRGTVRAVNRFGAAVAAAPNAFTVDGGAVTVSFDGVGYGGIVIEEPGEVEVGGGTVPARLHTVVSSWPGAGLHDAWRVPMLEPPEWTGALSNGMVSASGSEVWWAGPGVAPHRVLAADAPILGFRDANIDVDGVTDAIAWTASTVYLLRGRAGGGMGWGGALRADNLGVGGVDVADLSGDNLPDIAIAWVNAEGSGVLDVWEGDGLFQFEPAAPRGIPGKAVDLIIGDNTGEGTPQITVIHQTGAEWSRYIRGAEKQYIPIGPFMPVAGGVFPVGSSLMRAGDTNDDGADELALVAPLVSGTVREAFFFDLHIDVDACASGAPNAQCSVQYLPVQQDIGSYFAVGDGNADRVEDIWLLEETESRLYSISWSPDDLDSKFHKTGLIFMPEYAPIAVLDVDLDGSPELHVAGPELWWRFNGQGFGSDPDRFWEPRPGPTVQVREDLVGPFAFAELDADPTTLHALAFALEGGDTVFKVLEYVPGQGRAPSVGNEVVDDAGVTPDDISVCGTNAWVAVGGRILRVDVSTPTNPSIAYTGGTTVTRVDCGAGPFGATAAFLQGGEVVLVNNAGTEVGTIPAPDARDVALGDFGSGPVVETCSTEGCSVVFWPWGAAGEAVFARGDASGTTLVDATGTETQSGGGGDLSVGDVDGDGNLDLLGRRGDHSLISLHRSTGVSIAPPELFHSTRGLSGALSIADGDADGFADLWALDGEGKLKFTQPPRDDTESTWTPIPTGDTGEPTTTSISTGSTGDTGP